MNDIFLKLSGVTGESLDHRHRDEIEVLRWEWSVSQMAGLHSGHGGGAGKATVGDLRFDHYLDRSSPTLLKYCLGGRHIANATLVVRAAGGTPLEYLKIVMDDVIVTGVAPVTVDSMARVREQVGLSFARVKQEYVIQNPQGGSGGTVSFGYDIRANCEM